MKVISLKDNKMIVVADASGNIRMAFWPGDRTVGAPSYGAVGLEDGQVSHEVDVPEELFRKDRPVLSEYYLQTLKDGPTALARRSK